MMIIKWISRRVALTIFTVIPTDTIVDQGMYENLVLFMSRNMQGAVERVLSNIFYTNTVNRTAANHAAFFSGISWWLSWQSAWLSWSCYILSNWDAPFCMRILRITWRAFVTPKNYCHLFLKSLLAPLMMSGRPSSLSFTHGIIAGTSKDLLTITRYTH